ncbi:MAG: polysaccharide deacetylase family protein [Candidatus Eisenbacteria bacterium]
MTTRQPQHFLFPGRFFEARVGALPAVPAYQYHQFDPQDFGEICSALERRRIRTLTFSDLMNGADAPSRSVLLTADDGWSSVWSIAFPLLRRHGFRMTLFLPPDTLEESEERRPGLDDGCPEAELIARDHGDRPLLTWGEVRAMQASGLIDLQSHSSHHGLIFVSEGVVGEVDAQGRPFPVDGHVPLVMQIAGNAVPVFRPNPGTPLRELGAALQGRRYIEPTNGDPGRWETEQERRARHREDLAHSKASLEAHVPGASVRVLSPPWGDMHPELPAIAGEVGFELLVLGYPFTRGDGGPLPAYPRLFGDAIWTWIDGPFQGGLRWWRNRRRSLARRRAGAIP